MHIMRHMSVSNEELRVHHESSQSNTVFTEESVSSIVNYLNTHTNPFQSGNQSLRNLETGIMVDDKAADLMFKVFEIGCNLYNIFRKERIIDKKIPLSETIHRVNIPSFDTVIDEKKHNEVKRKKTDQQFRRCIDIARARNYDIEIRIGFRKLSFW